MLIHVLSHTHWDREWYQPAGRFRQRLVALMDELLDCPPAEGTSFLLDGQAVVLEDYLAVRPERSSELSALLRRGALEAGPWYVLADALIPGAESLVRNLLAGRRVLRALRAEAPPVLYCPDAFGHPAALPELACGFGCELAIVWRGYGGRRWPAGDAAHWRAPSGASVLLYHLPPGGYEVGASLPGDLAGAQARWATLRPVTVGRARLGVALLPNGADHHARQRELGVALAALQEAAVPVRVRPSSLRGFAVAALQGAREADLPSIAGELRDSYGYTWTLQGTLGVRAHQKRRAAMLERLLVNEVEPWAALAARRTGQSSRALAQAAWRELLLCQPHDTLCGCSTDEVARAFDVRVDSGLAQARGLRDDALAVLGGVDIEIARAQPAAWRPHLVLRNPAPQARGGVAIVTLSRVLEHVSAGPGSGALARPAASSRRALPAIAGVDATQVLRREVVHERLESPRGYPCDDLVERTTLAIWAPDVPGFAVQSLPLGGRARRNATVPYSVRASESALTNGLVSVEVGADGAVMLLNLASGRRAQGFVSLESQDDAGDLYTASLRGPVRAAQSRGVVLRHKGPLMGTLETAWQLPVRRGQAVSATVAISLYAGSPVIRVGVTGVNAATDHRLRIRFASDVQDPAVHAEAAFGPVERRPITPNPLDSAMETAPPTAPLHRYVTVSNAEHGATIFSDGLAEYEAEASGAVAVTLLRAVGELSRSDLPERPGNAGWPTPVPQAQCIGEFEANFGVWWHGAWSETVSTIVERLAADVLTPVTGATTRWLLQTPLISEGITLDGPGLACSAIKESEDGQWLVLRCVNLFTRAVTGWWLLPSWAHEAHLSRLDEAVGDALPVVDGRVEVRAGPRAVVTILVR